MTRDDIVELMCLGSMLDVEEAQRELDALLLTARNEQRREIAALANEHGFIALRDAILSRIEPEDAP